jgi:murein DD-endopeptidase MepM/ murein hydrolase activator NlpD
MPTKVMSSKSIFKQSKYYPLALAGIVCLSIFGSPGNTAAKGHVVAIDAGHGSLGNSRSDEGRIELQTAFRLKSILEKDGYSVVMTRTSNGQSIGGVRPRRGVSGLDTEHLNLAARGNIANQANAELVVSIHSDAHDRDQFAILYSDTANVKDRMGHVIQRDSGYLTRCKNAGTYFYQSMKGNGFTPSSDRPLRGEAYNNSSRPETLGMPLAFTAHTKAPVVTVEVFGHTSSRLMAKYSQASTQDKVVSALEDGVNKYFNNPTNQRAEAKSDQVTTKKNTEDLAKKPAAEDSPIVAKGKVIEQTGPLNPKSNRSEKCPPESPNAGPGAGEDYREQIAQVFSHLINEITNEANNEENTVNNQIEDGNANPIITGKGECALPVPKHTYISSGLGDTRGSAAHSGLDFPAPLGTTIVSVMDGTVFKVGDGGLRDGSGYRGNLEYSRGHGNFVIIKHDNGLFSIYAHVRTGHMKVREGQRVTKGQPIAEVDHNGWSTGNHLHFTLSRSSSSRNFINPKSCLGL